MHAELSRWQRNRDLEFHRAHIDTLMGSPPTSFAGLPVSWVNEAIAAPAALPVAGCSSSHQAVQTFCACSSAPAQSTNIGVNGVVSKRQWRLFVSMEVLLVRHLNCCFAAVRPGFVICGQLGPVDVCDRRANGVLHARVEAHVPRKITVVGRRADLFRARRL